MNDKPLSKSIAYKISAEAVSALYYLAFPLIYGLLTRQPWPLILTSATCLTIAIAGVFTSGRREVRAARTAFEIWILLSFPILAYLIFCMSPRSGFAICIFTLTLTGLARSKPPWMILPASLAGALIIPVIADLPFGWFSILFALSLSIPAAMFVFVYRRALTKPMILTWMFCAWSIFLPLLAISFMGIYFGIRSDIADEISKQDGVERVAPKMNPASYLCAIPIRDGYAATLKFDRSRRFLVTGPDGTVGYHYKAVGESADNIERGPGNTLIFSSNNALLKFDLEKQRVEPIATIMGARQFSVIRTSRDKSFAVVSPDLDPFFAKIDLATGNVRKYPLQTPCINLDLDTRGRHAIVDSDPLTGPPFAPALLVVKAVFSHSQILRVDLDTGSIVAKRDVPLDLYSVSSDEASGTVYVAGFFRGYFAALNDKNLNALWEKNTRSFLRAPKSIPEAGVVAVSDHTRGLIRLFDRKTGKSAGQILIGRGVRWLDHYAHGKLLAAGEAGIYSITLPSIKK